MRKRVYTEAQREANKACKKAWYVRNLERLHKKRLETYQKNRLEAIEYSKKYAKNNPEKILEFKKKYTAEHKQQKREYDKLYRANATEEQKSKWREQKRNWDYRNQDYKKEYRETHKEQIRELKKNWSIRNQSVVRAKNRLYFQRRAEFSIDPHAADFYVFVRSQKSIPCYYCHKRISGKDAHIDHVIAIAKNGNHSTENLAASCPSCNLKKSAKLPSETNFNNQPLLNL